MKSSECGDERNTLLRRRRYLAASLGFVAGSGCLQFSDRRLTTTAPTDNPTTVSPTARATTSVSSPTERSTPANETPSETPTATQTPAEAREGWPEFRYDTANTGYKPHATGPSTLTEQWRVETNDGITASPVVADGSVYVGTDQGIYALRASDGQEQWSVELSAGISTAPAVAGDSVYVATNDDRLYSFAVANGAEQWIADDASRYAPSVADETVFVGGKAFDAATGQFLWGFGSDGLITGHPALTDERIYVQGGENNDTLYALDRRRGSEYWHRTDHLWKNTPAIANGRVYIAYLIEQGGNLAVSAMTDHGGSVSIDWTSEMEASNPTPGGYSRTTPVAVTDQTVYAGTKNNAIPATGEGSHYLYAFNATDGSERWRYSPNGAVWEAPAVVGETVYFPAGNRVMAINAGDGAPTATYQFDAEEDIRSSPAVADQRVFATHRTGTVVALGDD